VRGVGYLQQPAKMIFLVLTTFKAKALSGNASLTTKKTFEGQKSAPRREVIRFILSLPIHLPDTRSTALVQFNSLSNVLIFKELKRNLACQHFDVNKHFLNLFFHVLNQSLA